MIKQLYFIYLLGVFSLCFNTVSGQPVGLDFSTVSTPAYCETDGSITVTATGSVGQVKYELVSSSIFIPAQNDPVFLNLSPGTYTVGVYDDNNSTTPVSKQVVVEDKRPAKTFTITGIGSNRLAYCPGDTDPGTTLGVSFDGGSVPYTVTLLDANDNVLAQTTTSTGVASFPGIYSGVYKATAMDNCGVTVNGQSGYTVPSNIVYNYSLSSGGSQASGITVVRGAGGTICDPLTQAYYEFQKGGFPMISDNVPSFGTRPTDVTYAAEYDGIKTAYMTRAQFEAYKQPLPLDPATWKPLTVWVSICGVEKSIAIDLPRYSAGYLPSPIANENVTLLITDDPANTLCIPTGFVNLSRFTGLGNVGCAPVTLTITEKNNAVPVQQVTDVTGTNQGFNILLAIGNTYSLKFTDKNGNELNSFAYSNQTKGRNLRISKTSEIYIDPATFSPKTQDDIPVELRNSPDYKNFGKTKLGLFLTPGLPFPLNVVITGPDNYSSQKSFNRNSNSIELLGDNLSLGDYSVRLTSPTACYDKTFPITLNSVIDSISVSYTITPDGLACDRYVKNFAYRLNFRGSLLSSFDAPNVGFVVLNGPSGFQFRSPSPSRWDMGGRNNSIINARFNGDIAGLYEIGLVNIDNPTESYGGPYRLDVKSEFPVFDMNNSGGAICNGATTGTLKIAVKNAVSPVYFLKKKTDANYPATGQNSPDFPNLIAGEYSVKVETACYPVALEASFRMDNVGNLGSIIDGNTTICTGSPLNLTTKSIGSVNSITWKLPDGSTVTTNSLVLNNAQPGEYSAIVTTAAGCIVNDKVQVKINAVATPADITANGQTICAGETAYLTATSTTIANPIFNWYSDQALTQLLVSAASYAPQPNKTTSYYVTVKGDNTCENAAGNAQVVTVGLYTARVIEQPADLVFNNNDPTTEIIFKSNAYATYSWTNDNPAIGLSANGLGDISSFRAVNLEKVPIVAHLRVTPISNGCSGAPVDFTITVNPTADLIQPLDQVTCTNVSTSEVIFKSNVAGTKYRWTNNTPGIGLGANGTGDIPSFTTVNIGTVPLVATITVIPAVNGHDGIPVNFTITVNPIADVIKPADQTFFNDVMTSAIIFKSHIGEITYSWTNDNTNIGLGSNGIGDIPAFMAINTGTAPLIAHITVTPSANGCTGIPVDFILKVYPTIDVIQPADITVCNTVATAEIDFSSSIIIPGTTTYSWTNDNIDIGLAANGIGNLPSFIALNKGTDPASATITVTPKINEVTGLPKTFKIVINPTANVIQSSDQIVCNAASTRDIIFNSNVTGTTYSWENDNTSIGLAAKGIGNIVSFNAVNTSNTVVTANIIVTPEANGCSGIPVNFTITVNPTVTLIRPVNVEVDNEVIIPEIIFKSNVVGTTYSWTNDNPAIGLSANGLGDISSFRAVNLEKVPIVAHLRVTPIANGCSGAPVDFTITVNPTADLIQPLDQVTCTNVSTSEVIFKSNVAGTKYRWTNNTPGIGLGANGTGDIPSFTTVNIGTVPLVATITVIPAVNGHDGIPVNFTITVNPIADVIKPDDQTFFNDVMTSAIIFKSHIGETTYSWTNDNTNIGLGSNGIGDIPAFMAINTGTAPLIAHITVTPSANGCTGIPVDFILKVYPTIDVIQPADITVCNTVATAEIDFSSSIIIPGTTTYSWTNDNIDIGLAANGIGNLPSFIALNKGTDPASATITVTPKINEVTGLPKTFKIVINPTANVIQSSDQIVCNAASTRDIIFNSNVTGTTYSWENDNTSIGLAAKGIGNIVSFNAVNTSNTVVTANIIVTPEANGCSGIPVNFTITVNPTVTLIRPVNVEVDNEVIIPEIIFKGNVVGTTYSWTNDNPAIGLSANGLGDISSFRAVNLEKVPIVAHLRVTPVSNGCSGAPVDFTITVNPTADLIQPLDQVTCTNVSTSEVIFKSNVAGTKYRWTNNTPGIGLGANGTGDIPSFTTVNIGTVPLVATITVIPAVNGHDGIPVNFTITVNPIADVIKPADQTICNAGILPDINFSSNVSGATYIWSSDNVSIGLGKNGSDRIASFRAVNTGLTPIKANITITPIAYGCSGIPRTFTITVMPTVNIIQPQDKNVCNNSIVESFIFKSNIAGTSYKWTNDNPSIGLAASGIGNIDSFVANNDGLTPLKANIRVIPEANGCIGEGVSFILTINPSIKVISKSLNICGIAGVVNLKMGIMNYDDTRYVYSFYRPDQTKLSSDEINSISEPGFYKVKSEDKIIGCESEFVDILVKRITLPVVNINHPDPTYEPFTIDLTNEKITTGSEQGLKYQYYLDDLATKLLSNPDKVGGKAGNYTYYVVGRNPATGCLSTPMAIKVKILPAPKLLISSTEIDEGQSAKLKISLPEGVLLPETIDIYLSGSKIKIPYRIPASVRLLAGTSSVTFEFTTQKSNLILKDQQNLTINGRHNYYQIIPGIVKINDLITNKPNYPIILNISNGRIYEQGEVTLSVSLPDNLITDHDLEVVLSKGAGTTLNNTNYSFPSKVVIAAGKGDSQFKIKADNTTGTAQKVVVDGAASALGFDFSVKSAIVIIDGQRLVVGNVISDNGDGINDYFNIENINEYSDNEVVVFNRWGQEVYRAKGYNNESIRFDSRSNVGSSGGKKVPDGTYYYLITINKQGKRLQFKGFIKIKRS